MSDESCGARLNVEPPRYCTLPKGHEGPHETTVSHSWGPAFTGRVTLGQAKDDKGETWNLAGSDMVNHPNHYTRGPAVLVRANIEPDGTGGHWTRSTMELGRKIYIHLECIEVIRHIHDMRLATAMKYLWRVSFGGKANDTEDVRKAIWYLQDWVDFPPGPPSGASSAIER